MQPVDLLNLLSNSELPQLNHALLKEMSLICWHVTAQINHWMSAFYGLVLASLISFTTWMMSTKQTLVILDDWLVTPVFFLKLHPNRKQFILYSKGPGLVSSCNYNKNQCLLLACFFHATVSDNKLSTSNPSIPLKRLVLLTVSSLVDNIHLEWHLCAMWQRSNKHRHYI